MTAVLRFDDVWKAYRTGPRRPADAARRSSRAALRGGGRALRWALRDVSLELDAGERSG